ncbi:MAG: DEAD/DEAH box helicase [Nostoc sp. JL31]|uniref:DEAD/DEAH box helicase n=1 Tax=Nostoc sp. JL31 TaxID=2815395 RepID=UPI0025FC8C19|nr:DEAD/DEAH box helicase [Nostoc sp. JL31]MBN3892148.1 DEAD/DEAH box helicase [Nostoc sp. JL31]
MKERQKITRFNGISNWLSNSVSESEDKRYTHRLLKEDKNQRDIILNELILIVQKAHEDARYRLRKLAGNSLFPFGDFSESDPSYGYPERLNIISRQSYFGDIFSGIIAENFAHFGQDDWEVPAFLFRFHLVEFQHLEFLNQTEEIAKKRPGRTGDDCLAFLRNSEGVIIASLFCEAKCTTNHYTIMIAEAHKKVSEPHIKPVDIPQIIEIFGDYNDLYSSEWVDSLRVLWLEKVDINYERYDLISYICGKHPVENPTWISPEKPHEQYTAGRRLEAVEIHLHEVENLVTTVYSQPAIATLSIDIPTQTVQQPDDAEIAKANSDVIVEGEVLQNEMTQPSNEVIALAKELQNSLAGNRLTPAIAKLYSQHTRLRAGGKGLTGWREDEAGERLNDAMRLIEAAFIQRETGDTNWRNGMLRAGELFEWLSHPQLNPDILPIRLLAAAVYELAGYPARAAGLLNEDISEGVESEILRSLLKADFPTLLQRLTEYWATVTSSNFQTETSLLWDDADTGADRFNKLIVKETASSLGILCAKMRWGNEPRLERAIEKLSDIAKVLLHGHDTYSWLLGKLCAEVTSVYIQTSLRHHLELLSQMITPNGRNFLERYLRQSYQKCKALAWRSQVCGIERLARAESFALCTPTGSGKTTIAEIAILQSLFLETTNSNNFSSSAPLVIYLVPSRALATEVESNLSRVLKRSTNNNVIVTGLYGGTDWGPTDVWLTSEQPTVLICTYEKAEALMKFLGSLFIRRVSLIVLDEAHAVQFDGNKDSLQKAENRSLRLESLGARLFTYVEQNHSRIIALSAVASQTENALASWIENSTDASPAKTNYRSTRQLIGRLECLPGRRFEIRYDLLDGRKLEFQEGGQADTPFIPNPFPTYPPVPKGKNEGAEKRLRPYLFWAAMHLAAPDEKGQRRAVLISVTQQPGGYAEDFLKLLKTWSQIEMPSFFQEPIEAEKLEVWQKCLRSCEDYFGTKSREYQLLEKGIIVHHGKMPGLMARLLIDVIDEKIVHLVLATSTLSEGVNLPFETVLIPTLRRGTGELNIREFGNLVGRSGRPGFGTEGRSLVLLNNQSTDWSDKEARKRYLSLIGELENQTQAINQNANPLSPLAELLLRLEEQWQLISSSNRQDNFLIWLEKTAPLDPDNNLSDAQLSAIETLDSLDSILLSAIVEIEQLVAKDLSPNELEEHLQKIWHRSFAHYASREQERLENLFIRRGRALKTEIYKDVSQRRRLYRTSLPPRAGNELLTLYPKLKEQLSVSGDYAIWTPEERFNYVQDIVSNLTSLSKFRLSDPSGNISWNEILCWWLDPNKAMKKPNLTQISKWHSYISQNFGYRFNWGLGSVIALAMDEAFRGELVESSLENWSQIGLPWIVFWMKELIVWGTLDPVAAYLLAKVEDVTTRKQAEELAQTYYHYISERESEPNEYLNAVNIKNWVEQSFSSVERHLPTPKPANQINVNLLKDFSKAPSKNWRVVPVEIGDEIQWFDLAGFPLAICQKPEKWQSDFLNTYDFMLDAENRFVSSKIYV